MNTTDKAEQWVEEDIIKNYRNTDGTNDFRVHMVRVNNKTIGTMKAACAKFGVVCVEHTSDDRLTKHDEELYFEKPIHTHVVLLVKGLFRRANLIPNKWKLRIGATHELWTKKVDNNVQIQGFPGRMSGYWAEIIEGGHKTGPYRTSIQAVEEYEKSFVDPFAKSKYNCAGFSKNKRGVVAITTDSLVSANNIDGLDPVVAQVDNDKAYEVFDTQDAAILMVKERFDRKLNKRSGEPRAPEELLTNGINPTIEYLMGRMWGLSDKNKVRMVPTNENKWCVYWRPSSFA